MNGTHTTRSTGPRWRLPYKRCLNAFVLSRRMSLMVRYQSLLRGWPTGGPRTHRQGTQHCHRASSIISLRSENSKSHPRHNLPYLNQIDIRLPPLPLTVTAPPRPTFTSTSSTRTEYTMAVPRSTLNDLARPLYSAAKERLSKTRRSIRSSPTRPLRTLMASEHRQSGPKSNTRSPIVSILHPPLTCSHALATRSALFKTLSRFGSLSRDASSSIRWPSISYAPKGMQVLPYSDKAKTPERIRRNSEPSLFFTALFNTALIWTEGFTEFVCNSPSLIAIVTIPV